MIPRLNLSEYEKIVLILILIFAFSVPVCAEGTDLYAEQYGISGADGLDGALPDSAKDFFSENRIEPSDPSWVNSLSGENVFRHIWGFLTSGAKTPLKTCAAVIGIILITAALTAMNEKDGIMPTAVYASVLAVASVIAMPVFSSVNTAVNAMKGSAAFMLSFIPVFASVVAASGKAVTAASMSTLLLGSAQAVSYISNFVVIPLMGGYLAVSISSSVSPLVSRSGIAEGIKKLAFWILSLITTLFLGVLSIQTAVNSAADTLSMRTAKFILGTSVPIAGTALSEAVSTVTSSLSLLKSSVGIYGVVAAAAIFLPIAAELVLWRLMLMLTSSVSQIFSLVRISAVLKAVDAMLSLLIGTVLLTAAMFIISLAVVVGVRV